MPYNKDRLEAIIVAFSYLDLLSVTLPENLKVLDHIIIITKQDDEIIDFCKKLNNNKITIIITDVFNYDGAVFNKGLAINIGFRHLRYNSWIMTLDGDIVLPLDFKSKFLDSKPDIECIFGSRRYNFDTREDWLSFTDKKKNIDEFILYRGYGFGYLTMWNFNSTTFQRLLKENDGLAYPFWIKEARDIDWIMVRNWNGGEIIFDPPFIKFPDDHFATQKDYPKGLLREIPCYCYHLGEPGKNHETRTTSQF